MPPAVAIIAGALLLLAGRKLFWLFIAVTGFFVGVEVARDLFANQPEWVTWVFAVGAGVIGAVLAMLFERVAFALAGLYAGGYLAMLLVDQLGLALPELGVFLAGGILGAVLATLVMDWAIIILSSLVGAGMIVAALGLEALAAGAAAGAMAAVGIAVQAALMRGKLGNPVKR